MIAPTNTIHIATVPWDSSYSEVMYFKDETARDSYLTSVTSYTDTNCTFIRKEEAVNVAVRYNDVLRSNYVWFYNSDFLGSQGNKFVGCFIDKIEYVSPERTKLYLKEDVWTTWVFLIDEWSDCYVKRQHVAKSDDVKGKIWLTDDLEVTPYVQNHSELCTILNEKYIVLALTTNVPSSPLASYTPDSFGNVPCGLALYWFNFDLLGLQKLGSLLIEVNSNDRQVSGLFTYPKSIIDNLVTTTETIGNVSQLNRVRENNVGQRYESAYNPIAFEGEAANDLDTYQPLNNIMLLYPYVYIEIQSNNGEKSKYRYEEICAGENRLYQFNLLYPLVMGVSPIIYPNYIKSAVSGTMANAFNTIGYGITGSPMSNGSITSDSFAEWFSTNSNKMGANLITTLSGSLTSGAKSALTGDIAGLGGSAVSVVNTVLNTVGTISDALNENDSYRNFGVANNYECANLNSFVLKKYSLRNSDAKRIDRFYSRYGYKINDITTLNITARNIFNYIETDGIHISGNLPDYARLQIAQAFDRGITIWHTTNNFGEYNDTIFANNN